MLVSFLRRLVQYLGLMLVSFLIAAEFLLRGGIAMDVMGLRDPSLYADPLSDDDYHKLKFRWQTFGYYINPIGSIDLTLGWAPRKTQENPLGITSKTPYEKEFKEGTILFFGDSFVQGMGAIEERIPQQLDMLLPDRRVLNYGVGGYGVDQILLRFRETHPSFRNPIIVLGIFMMDLDRSILSVRTSQKPYFVLENEELVLRGLPINPDPEAFLAAHPPSINSYLVAFLTRRARLGADDHTELSYMREEKKLINRHLLKAIVEEAKQHQQPLFLVVFYIKQDLKKTGWREIYLREEIKQLGVPYLDSKPPILEAAKTQDLPLNAFFRNTDPHLNGLGNRVVAEALAKRLRDGEFLPRIEPPD